MVSHLQYYFWSFQTIRQCAFVQLVVPVAGGADRVDLSFEFDNGYVKKLD